MLAVGLVFFTAFGVAFLAQLVSSSVRLEERFCSLGAVVSTTDAVAASSISRRIGLPKPVIDTLEGKSLINEPTGLLALSFAIETSAA